MQLIEEEERDDSFRDWTLLPTQTGQARFMPAVYDGEPQGRNKVAQ